MVHLAFANTRAGTLDMDQWPALRCRSIEADGSTAHEECSCDASSFLS